MKELIRVIVQALVDIPAEVKVNEIKSESVTIFEVQVAKTDTGKVLGKHGRNVDALRTILAAAAAKQRRRCIIQILE
ncbi:MAG: KH domain-containing protein [Desulfobacterales bacterium]